MSLAPLSYALGKVMQNVLATGLMISLCTIQNRPTTRTATGRVDDADPSNWTDSGLAAGPRGKSDASSRRFPLGGSRQDPGKPSWPTGPGNTRMST